MNLLGHLYFSNNDKELMYANLFGDFVKGKDLSQYPQKIQEGIHLHRTIDTYIDHHPAVLELLHELYIPLPKVAGIAVDLYFDHLLAKNWKDFSTVDLTEFLDEFHRYDIDLRPFNKLEFEYFIAKMREFKWMYHYKDIYGLTKASQGISNRLSFENALVNAPAVFESYEGIITQAFRSYMADAIPHFEAYYAAHLT